MAALSQQKRPKSTSTGGNGGSSSGGAAPSTSQSATPTLAMQSAGGGGNSAALAMMDASSKKATPTPTGSTAPVQGPMGRVFNRILGLNENDTTSAGLAFNRDQLRAYLDEKLKLADGEWFRGAKLDGVTDALMKRLDKDGDGSVTWEEFRTFRAQTLSTVAPGAKVGDDEATVEKAASARFDALDKSRDGSVNYDELKQGTEDALPSNTRHKGLVADLGARISLDAADADQRDKQVADRTLTKAEWLAAAKALAQP